MMQKWLLVALLVLQAHFAASYLVPLDREGQRTFGGLLGWGWPWAYGDGGLLGQITTSTGFPIAGFYLAMATAAVLLMAALALVGLWVPFLWWRTLAMVGAALSVLLLALFFGPTKLLPMMCALLVFWLATSNWAALATE